MAAASSEIDVALQELEARLERLRALYEQYFIGIEKIEPSVPRQDVDRRIYALRKAQIRNTAKRFKLQTIIQRYNAFQQYWLRVCREIENGTYHRHVARAQNRFGDVPLTAAARRRARLQAQNSTEEQQQAAIEQGARARKAADDDLEALLEEDLDAALSRALMAADEIESPVAAAPPQDLSPSAAIERRAGRAAPVVVASSNAVMPAEGTSQGRGPALGEPLNAPSFSPPRPKPVDSGLPSKGPPKPPPRIRPASAGAPGTSAAGDAATKEPATRVTGPAIGPGAATPGASPPVAPAPAARATSLPDTSPAGAGALPPRVVAPAGASHRAPRQVAPGPAPGAVSRPGATAAAPPVSARSGAAAPPIPAVAPAPSSPRAPQTSGADASKQTGVAAQPVRPAVTVEPAAAARPPREIGGRKARPAPAVAKASEGGGDVWAALKGPAGGQRPAAAASGGPSAASRAPRQAEIASSTGAVPAASGQRTPKLDASAPAAASPRVRSAAAAPQRDPEAAATKAAPEPAPRTGAAKPAPLQAAAEARAAASQGGAAEARAAAAVARAAAGRAADARSHVQAAGGGAGLDDQRLSQLHGTLVSERRRLNQPGKVSKDALAASLRDTETKLRKQYADKNIEFRVVVKDGKAVVKPIIG